MNLSPHFTLEELTNSQTAVRQGIDNVPPPHELQNLFRVAEILEQVRDLVGKPINVSSGYRSPSLNKAIGGAPDSAHVKGLAADINAYGMSARDLALKIQASGILYDQLIYEGTWVHIGLSDTPPRRESLTAHFGTKTTYSKGIQ